MNLALQNAYKHPVSTIRGILGFLVAVGVVLLAEPALASGIPPRILTALTAGSALAKLLLSVMGKDVDREEVLKPGAPDTQMAETVGKPVDPTAQVVTPDAKG